MADANRCSGCGHRPHDGALCRVLTDDRDGPDMRTHPCDCAGETTEE